MATIFDISSAAAGCRVFTWLSRAERNEIPNKYFSVEQLTFNWRFKFIDDHNKWDCENIHKDLSWKTSLLLMTHFLMITDAENIWNASTDLAKWVNAWQVCWQQRLRLVFFLPNASERASNIISPPSIFLGEWNEYIKETDRKTIAKKKLWRSKWVKLSD